MQKEKKQSQLLALLSEILKLYHQYLLCSLRQDLLIDRKNGLLENIRDRIRLILERSLLLQPQPLLQAQAELHLGEEDSKEKYSSKLVSRFLARLSEKIKAYMDQFTKDDLPGFLLTAMEAIQKTTTQFRLPDLLTSLFALSPPPAPTKPTQQEESAISPSHHLMELPEKRTAKPSTVSSPQSVQRVLRVELSRDKVNLMSTYTKNSHFVQELLGLIGFMDVDEKDLRRKYLAVQQTVNETQSQSQNNVRPLHSQNDQIMSSTYASLSTIGAFDQKQRGQVTVGGSSLMVTNATQYALANNQAFLEMLQRNRNIGQMIKKYQTCYEKYRKREQSKIERCREREKDKERNRDRLSMPSIHLSESKPGQPTGASKPDPEWINDGVADDTESKIPKKVSPRQIHTQIQRELHREVYNETTDADEGQTLHPEFNDREDEADHESQGRSQNPSFPELKTVKFEYNIERFHLPMNNLNAKNNILNKKAEKLLKIIKPSFNPSLEPRSQRKQKSTSTSALSTLNPISTHMKNAHGIPNAETDLSLELNYKEYSPPTYAPNTTNTQSDLILSTSTYNNLNSMVRSKQILNKLLNRISSTATEMEGSLICLSKLPAEGHCQKEPERKGQFPFDLGNIAYGDHSYKQNPANDTHLGSFQRSKKPLLYRQELLERRAKAQAMYNKCRPSHIGSLRSNICFTKMQEIEAPSFLMACRSYQRTAELNQKNETKSTAVNRQRA